MFLKKKVRRNNENKYISSKWVKTELKTNLTIYLFFHMAMLVNPIFLLAFIWDMILVWDLVLTHPFFLLGSSLVLGSGLGLGSNAVFISGSKIRTRSGEILGSWFGTLSWFEHGLYFRFGPKHLIGICFWFGIRSWFRTRFLNQV